jgi:hypothetical protein
MKIKNTIAFSSLRFVTIDVVGDILYWPVWWYSKGLLNAGRYLLGGVAQQYQTLGLGIWVKHIFTPMFGQYDIEGRIISFFARLIQIIFRSLILVFWTIVLLILFLLWVVGPLYIGYQVVINSIGLLT